MRNRDEGYRFYRVSRPNASCWRAIDAGTRVWRTVVGLLDGHDLVARPAQFFDHIQGSGLVLPRHERDGHHRRPGDLTFGAVLHVARPWIVARDRIGRPARDAA